jgi:hypothetical protein
VLRGEQGREFGDGLLRAACPLVVQGARHEQVGRRTGPALNAYYLSAGYQVVGRKEGKPQPSGAPKSFTLFEKSISGGDE